MELEMGWALRRPRGASTTMHPVVTRTDARLDRVEDVTRTVAETTQPGGADALAALLDRLPALAYAMDHEVMPLVCHLDQLGLEVDRLLDRFARLSHMTRRLPRVFRRGSSPHS
jgi:hypothetical protein